MNMMTSKPLTGAASTKEAFALAGGDLDILKDSRLRARNGQFYYSRRLIQLNLEKKKREQENVKRNASSDGRTGTSVCEDRGGPKGVGSLKLALKKFFSRLFGSKKPS